MASLYLLIRKLQKLDFDPACIWALQRIYEVEETGILNRKEWAPWYLLAFVKFLAKYSSSRRVQRIGDVYRVYCYFDEFMKTQKDPYLNDKTENLNKFFIRLANIQFPVQKPLTGLKYRIARQKRLFSQVEFETAAAKSFPHELFASFCFYLFSHIVINRKRTFTIKDIENFPSDYSSEYLIKFMDGFSVSEREISSYYYSSLSCRDYDFDFSLFETRPFIKIEDRYHLSSLGMFSLFNSYYFYDLIKAESGDRRKFGQVFDSYLTNLIYSQLPGVKTERDIFESLKHLGQKPKNVDAYLVTDRHVILFEYKATELVQDLKSVPSEENIRSLGMSFVSAIVQAYEFLGYMCKEGATGFSSSLPKVLFIVTYKETFIGTARNLWEDLLPAIQSKIEEKAGCFIQEDLPPSHIYFISVDQFEWLLTLKDQIDDIVQAMIEKIDGREVFEFGQVLADFLTLDSKLEELEPIFDEVFAKIEHLMEDLNGRVS
jgi:hypothetical protein